MESTLESIPSPLCGKLCIKLVRSLYTLRRKAAVKSAALGLLYHMRRLFARKKPRRFVRVKIAGLIARGRAVRSAKIRLDLDMPLWYN